MNVINFIFVFNSKIMMTTKKFFVEKEYFKIIVFTNYVRIVKIRLRKIFKINM